MWIDVSVHFGPFWFNLSVPRMKHTRTFGSFGLSFLLLLVTLGVVGCRHAGLEMRDGLPVETGGYYPPSHTGQGGGAYAGAPGGRYVNPPIHIPRTVPPGSAIRYNSVVTSQPLIAITFDDGPHPSHTPRLLDILAQRNVKATFYVVGSRVQSHPHIIARMIREGHEVANHTWNHPDLTKLSDAGTRSELQRTAQAIYQACGVYPRTYRPPYGAITDRHRRWIHGEFGYPTVTWNVDPRDWQKPGPSVVTSRLVSGARNGAILLAHDIHGGTVSAIPSALDQLLARGFRFVTVTQLIHAATTASASPEEGSAEKGSAEAVAAAGDWVASIAAAAYEDWGSEAGVAAAEEGGKPVASSKQEETPDPQEAGGIVGAGSEEVGTEVEVAEPADEPLAVADQEASGNSVSTPEAPGLR